MDDEQRKVQLYSALPVPVRLALQEMRVWAQHKRRGWDEAAESQLALMREAAVAMLGWEERALKAHDDNARLKDQQHQLEHTRQLSKRSQIVQRPPLRLVPKEPK